MNKPKVTKIAFSDGKAVRFRQDGAQMIVEYKMPGKPWVAIEPIALEPWEIEDAEGELSGIGRGEGAVNRVHPRSHPLIEQAEMTLSVAEARYRDMYRYLPRDTEFHEASRRIRREGEQEIIRGSRVRPRITPTGDFTVHPTNPNSGLRLTNFSTDVADYPSIEEGGADGTGVH